MQRIKHNAKYNELNEWNIGKEWNECLDYVSELNEKMHWMGRMK